MKFQVGDFIFYRHFINTQKHYGIIIEADDETVVVHWLIDATDHGYLQNTDGFFKAQ